tara:strand:+ start:1210 stop:1659 length:450 start_codon:yes stop_codon:yes gene_type:complete
MAEISINLIWKLENGEMLPGKYSNKHQVIFTPNIKITGDSAPEWRGNKLNTNPEQTLAASISSCHMMTFLALAAKMKWPVISYEDKAVAVLGKNSKGLMSVSEIKLNPKIEFSNDFVVDNKEMEKMQDRAHRYCFISNSLSDEVKVLIN